MCAAVEHWSYPEKYTFLLRFHKNSLRSTQLKIRLCCTFKLQWADKCWENADLLVCSLLRRRYTLLPVSDSCHRRWKLTEEQSTVCQHHTHTHTHWIHPIHFECITFIITVSVAGTHTLDMRTHTHVNHQCVGRQQEAASPSENTKLSRSENILSQEKVNSNRRLCTSVGGNTFSTLQLTRY